MKFSNINTSHELKAFLERSAFTHKFLYHYTNFDVLKCILKNKTWRFGNAKKMNDMHEYSVKGNSSPKWDNMYSTCFSFGDEDNIAMWSMYCIPWENAIRIRLPINAIRKWIKFVDQKRIKTADVDFIADFSKSHRMSLRDICYLNGCIGLPKNMSDCPLHNDDCLLDCKKCPPKQILWWSQRNRNFDIAIEKTCLKHDLIGYVKNSAWYYEMETRIVFEMLSLDATYYDYIDVPIPKQLYSKMQISIGPRATISVDEVKKAIATIIYNDPNKINNVSESYYKKNDLLRQLRKP